MLSRDEAGRMTRFSKVDKVFVRKARVLRLVLEDKTGKIEQIGTTRNHPFHVPSKGFVNAGDLTVGMQISTVENWKQPALHQVSGEDDTSGFLRVKSLSLEDEMTTVYNFEVAGTHTYFVGKSRAWVHNADCDPDLSGTKTQIHDGDSPETIRGHTRENESAEILSKEYNVEQNPPARENGRQPDYKINGEYADSYAPGASTSRDSVWDKIKQKSDNSEGHIQAENIVVHLGDSNVKSANLIQYIRRDIRTNPSRNLNIQLPNKIYIIDKFNKIRVYNIK